MRIIVTGGHGFTGKYLCNHLAKFNHTVKELTADLLDCDLLNKEVAAFKPESVVHLAGISNVHHEKVSEIYNINVVGTRNLLSTLASLDSQISSVILVSSAHIYSDEIDYPISENSPILPSSDYAVSKYAMELMANLWHDRLPITIIRPFNYTGIGQSNHFIIPKIVDHFRRREPSISLGNIMLHREFGDVRDVVEIYRRLVETPAVGKTLNLSTNESTRLCDVIDICKKTTGHQIEVKINKQFIRENEPLKLIGDDSKIRELFPDLKRKKLLDTLSWMLS